MTGHHGKPPEREAYGNLSFNEQDKQAALDYIIALNQLFIVDSNLAHHACHFFDINYHKKLKQISWLIAGLTVISEWLG